MAKLSISFSVDSEVYERCKTMFPDGRNQSVLIDLLDAYEKREHYTSKNIESNELLNSISNLFKCSKTDLVEVCKTHLSTINNLENEVSKLENRLTETSTSHSSLENEFENKIAQLEIDLNKLTEEKTLLENNVSQLEDERKSLENKVFQMENERIQMENNGIRLENERISLENEDIWLKIKRNITPFSAYLLENTAEKLSSRYNKEVKPLQILIDMFMRYTIEKWSQWFYPFVLSDKEILEIAQQINPEIKHINEIKKTLPK